MSSETSTPDPTPSAPSGSTPVTPDEPSGAGPRGDRARAVVVVLCWVAIAAGIALRFVPRSDLWLDEALSVNIARLPLGDLTEALRHDGHPPLYYALLHIWMAIGGESAWWVRALSGVFSVLSIPVGYVAGSRIAQRAGSDDDRRRLVALLSAAMVAVIPYGVRYGSETRMYSLLILLVLVGYVLVDDLTRVGRTGVRLWLTDAAAALVAAALLWTQYWSMYLLVTVGLIVLWKLWRPGSAGRDGPFRVLGALVVGGILYLPWVPSLLYQSAHTGTPWGEVLRPTTLLIVTVIDFAGRAVAEPQILSYLFVLLLVVAAMGVVTNRRSTGDGRDPQSGGDPPNDGAPAAEVLQVEPRTTPFVRLELIVLFGTLGVGSLASIATSSTYQPRYAAVVFPLFCLCVAAGLSLLRGTRTLAVVLALVLLGSVVSIGLEIHAPRTQAGEVADLIIADTHGDPSHAVVVTCPDQLAPATDRALRVRTGDDWTVIPFPSGGTPRRVDWVDYAKRNNAATVKGFLEHQAARIPPEDTVYYVFTPGYKTFGTKCEQLGAALRRQSDPRRGRRGRGGRREVLREHGTVGIPTGRLKVERRPIVIASIAWVWARVCVGAGFVVAHLAHSPDNGRTVHEGLLAWDAIFYVQISQGGYAGAPHEAVRFFPLYPTLGRALSPIFLGREDIALGVIANVGALVGAVLLWHLVTETLTDPTRRVASGLTSVGARGIADTTTWLVAIIPPAFILAFDYSEGLALALTVGTLLALQRRAWVWAAVWAALAAASRPVGGLLVIPIVIELLRARPRPTWGRAAAAVAAPFLGFAAAMLWIYRETHDLLAPLTAQRVVRAEFRDPIIRSLEAIWALFHHNFTDIENVPFIILWGLLLVVSLYKKQPWSWIAFSVATLLVATSAQTIDSLGRYGLMAVPLVIALAQWADKRWRQWLVAALGSAGVTWMTAEILLARIVP